MSKLAVTENEFVSDLSIATPDVVAAAAGARELALLPIESPFNAPSILLAQSAVEVQEMLGTSSGSSATSTSAGAAASGGAPAASSGLSLATWGWIGGGLAVAGVAAGGGDGGSSPTPDTTAPTVTISPTKWLKNDTTKVTFTFSENVTDFDTSKVTVTGGTLSNLQKSSQDSRIYTADVQVMSSNGSVQVSVLNGFKDAAGNTGNGGNPVGINYDLGAPTLTISSAIPGSVGAGQKALLTFTFSEVVSGFTASDITSTSNGISNFQTTADPKVFTAEFTPPAGASGSTSISVAPGSYTDILGNAGAAASVSQAYVNLLGAVSAGTADSSFNETGQFKSAVMTKDMGRAAAIQSDGKILVGGGGIYTVYFSTTRLMGNVIRLTSAGELDTSFSTDGISDGVGDVSMATSMVLTPAGTIYIAGASGSVVRGDAVGTLSSSGVINSGQTTNYANVHLDGSDVDLVRSSAGNFYVGTTSMGTGDFQIQALGPALANSLLTVMALG